MKLELLLISEHITQTKTSTHALTSALKLILVLFKVISSELTADTPSKVPVLSHKRRLCSDVDCRKMPTG